MNCDRFHLHLDAWLSNEIDPELGRALEAHLQVCEECATVAALCREQSDPAAAGFVQSVVGRTTGGICSSMEEMLGDWLDGRLERELARELAAHVDDCPRCAPLVVAMRRCDALLPGFAEIEPDANFTADVLMATLDDVSLWHVAYRRARDFFEWVLHRPAFPLEASFATTVLLVVLTATPLAPWPQLPARALSVVQAIGPQSADIDPVGATWSGLADSRPALLVAEGSSDATNALRDRWEHWRPRLVVLGDDFETLGSCLIRLDFDAWLPAARELGRDVRTLWAGADPRPVPDPQRSPSDE